MSLRSTCSMRLRLWGSRNSCVSRFRGSQGGQARFRGALERLREGNYGLCEGCRNPIPAPRLVAVPTAPTQKLRRIIDEGVGYGLALEGISAAEAVVRVAIRRRAWRRGGEARWERRGRDPERGLRPRQHDGERDVRQLRDGPGAGGDVRLRPRHGYGDALSQLRRRRLACRAHAHAAVAGPDGCEARRHDGRHGSLGRVTGADRLPSERELHGADYDLLLAERFVHAQS